MAIQYTTRRRLALAILVIGLPVYIGLVWWGISLLGDMPIWVEFGVYVIAGVAWAIPLKAIFKGVGKPPPPTEINRVNDDDAHMDEP